MARRLCELNFLDLNAAENKMFPAMETLKKSKWRPPSKKWRKLYRPC